MRNWILGAAALWDAHLDQLADATESSKSYMWELENKDDPKPSADKLARIAAVLDVTKRCIKIIRKPIWRCFAAIAWL